MNESAMESILLIIIRFFFSIILFIDSNFQAAGCLYYFRDIQTAGKMISVQTLITAYKNIEAVKSINKGFVFL